jgi:hypothetical protein
LTFLDVEMPPVVEIGRASRSDGLLEIQLCTLAGGEMTLPLSPWAAAQLLIVLEAYHQRRQHEGHTVRHDTQPSAH